MGWWTRRAGGPGEALKATVPMPPQPTSKPAVKSAETGRRNSLGINGPQLSDLIKRLGGESGKGSAREFQRWAFANVELNVEFTHPGGSKAKVRLCARNLSRWGMALLHNTYVYQGTLVQVELPTLDGKALPVLGRVRRCTHRGGVVHEIGVRFEAPIDLSRHVAATGGERAWAYENVNPEKLSGTAVVATRSAIDRRIVTHFLRQSSVRLSHAATAEQFAEVVASVDLAICDDAFLDAGGRGVALSLKSKGIPTPLLVIANDPNVAVVVGAFAHLPRPVTQQVLLRAVGEILMQKGEPGEADRGSVSTVPMDADLRRAFQEAVEALAKAVEKEDGTAILNGCAQLQAAAPLMGLPLISRLAQIAISQFPVAGSAEERRMLVSELVAACETALPKGK